VLLSQSDEPGGGETPGGGRETLPIVPPGQDAPKPGEPLTERQLEVLDTQSQLAGYKDRIDQANTRLEELGREQAVLLRNMATLQMSGELTQEKADAIRAEGADVSRRIGEVKAGLRSLVLGYDRAKNRAVLRGMDHEGVPFR